MRYILPFLLTLSALAQNSNDQTAQMSNGRAWDVFTESIKVGYTAGVYDSLVMSGVLGSEKITAENAPVANGFKVGDYVKELNRFYSDGENIRIPITLAMKFCTTKLKGQTKKEDLEASLISLRKLVSSFK
jgi:hypothetical protein